MTKGEALLVSTMNDLPGYRVTAVLGFVEGITMRASTVADSFLGSLQATAGDDDNTFVQLCQETRQKARAVMIERAAALGAHAILGMRYGAHDVVDGITEVLAYGTAVQIERV